MSNDAGDSPSRLSDALNDIFSRGEPEPEPEAHDTVDGGGAASGHNRSATQPQVPGEPYVLPEIVPATADPDTSAGAPRLPDRSARPSTPEGEPAPTVVPDTASTTPSPAPPTPPSPSAEPAAPPTPQGSAAAAPASTAPPATSWGDHMAPAPGAASQLRPPGRRPRVRRVTRVVRHVDPWSTFKVAALFNAVAYLVCLTSGVLLWRVADSTGTLDNVERWFTQFGWETFELDGGEVFHNAWIIGLFAAVAATGAAVLLVTLFNLVSDIVGGVRMTVLEEEVVERTISSTRRYVVRRPVDVDATGSAAAAWSADDLDDDGADATDTDPTGTEPSALDSSGDPPASDNGDGRDIGNPADVPTRPVPTTASDANDWSVD